MGSPDWLNFIVTGNPDVVDAIFAWSFICLPVFPCDGSVTLSCIRTWVGRMVDPGQFFISFLDIN